MTTNDPRAMTPSHDGPSEEAMKAADDWLKQCQCCQPGRDSLALAIDSHVRAAVEAERERIFNDVSEVIDRNILEASAAGVGVHLLKMSGEITAAIRAMPGSGK